ncbi:unnamed protein product [Durusdinium trenchii]|uniref:Uncharacterized protein n=1 Tax=Durusdinium trenchii TaxID=1381693 RepID=A0ABP0PN15_9DINO
MAFCDQLRLGQSDAGREEATRLGLPWRSAAIRCWMALIGLCEVQCVISHYGMASLEPLARLFKRKPVAFSEGSREVLGQSVAVAQLIPGPAAMWKEAAGQSAGHMASPSTVAKEVLESGLITKISWPLTADLAAAMVVVWDSLRKLQRSQSEEFAPIWFQKDPSFTGPNGSNVGSEDSRVAICRKDGQEVGAELVPVGKEETALSLRAKHALVASRLLQTLLEKGEGALPKLEKVVRVQGLGNSLNRVRRCKDSVDRYIRGSLFPPHDPAVVEVPGKSETYFIESMEQFNDFRMKVLEESGTRGLRLNQRSYAADTHWYSNVGGSIVKMGDSDIHMPLKTSEKKHKAIIPGAALGARKKLRMNEPLIGPNAERYCSAALASGWIGVEGPYVRGGGEVDPLAG